MLCRQTNHYLLHPNLSLLRILSIIFFTGKKKVDVTFHVLSRPELKSLLAIPCYTKISTRHVLGKLGDLYLGTILAFGFVSIS